jgi:hypothetical protein
MDILPGDKDPATESWALSSFTPGEQMSKELMAEVHMLNKSQPRNYTSLQGDFANRGSFIDLIETMGGERIDDDLASKLTPQELVQAMNGQKADIVLFSTIWYMLTNQDRRAMLDHALAITSENGLIIVQDHVGHIDFTEPVEDPLAHLHFPHEWNQWSYRTQVMDPRQPGPQFEEAIYYVNGRLEAVHFSDKYTDNLFSQRFRN